MIAIKEVTFDLCDCYTCLEDESPCCFDCEAGENECQGCRESRQGAEEIMFEIGCAQGRY